MKTTDGELLRKFIAENSQFAFEELFQRHRSMVMGVCHRVLGYAQDAEDAFQVTFLVLIQKAGSISHWDNIAGWLYQVALRTAYKLQAKRARQHQREVQIEEIHMGKESTTELDQIWQEVRPVLDMELDRLPTKYRSPVILCYLEGRTYEEAAQELGVPHSTVRKRLEYARELLKGRFIRRGITLSAGVLGTLLSQKTQASVSAPLITSTLTAATSLISPSVTGVATGIISTQVAALMKGTMKAMTIKKMIAVAAMLLILLGIGTGTGVTLRQTLKAQFSQKEEERSGETISVDQASKITSPFKQQTKDTESTLSEDSLTAKAVIDQIISEIENTDSQKSVDVEKIKRQLQRLKDFGQDGSKAIQAFLRTSQDIEVPIHHNVHFQSLRAILLENLYGMDDPIAKTANLEVLKSTPIGFEVFLAACNLEKLAPGVYREEVLKAVCEVLAHKPTNSDPIYQNHRQFDTQMMQFVGYYQAQGIIPEIEDLLFKKLSTTKRPSNDPFDMISAYLNAIRQFPAEDQVQVLKRLLIHDELMRDRILNASEWDSSVIAGLDFQNEEARQLAREAFVGLSSSQKDKWLQDIFGLTFASPSKKHHIRYMGCFADSRELFRSDNIDVVLENRLLKGRITGTLQLLDELSSQIDTPILKERLENAQNNLLRLK